MLPLSLEFCTTFESMFVLRGTPPGKRGRLLAPEWDGTALRFCYEGADGVRRTLLTDFSLPPVVAPRTTEQTVAHFELSLASRASLDLIVTCRVDERPVGETPPGSARTLQGAAAMREAKEAAAGRLLDGYARVQTSSKGFGEVLARSLSDVALLEVRRGEHRFTTAGVPWFVGLFGETACCPRYSASPSTPTSAPARPARWRTGRARRTTEGPASSRARSCTSCAWASWPTCTRFRRRRATPRWTRRRCS